MRSLHCFYVAASRHDGVFPGALITQLILKYLFQSVDALLSRCADRDSARAICFLDFTEDTATDITFIEDNNFSLI